MGTGNRDSASEQLALLVHDLNNGLTVAQASVELAREDVPDSGGARRSLGEAQLALERMRVMLQQFLDIYRLDHGSVRVRPAPVVLADVVEAAACGLRDTSDRFRLEVDAEAVATTIDAMLVERAIRNLLMNAVRYVDAGGVVRVAARRFEEQIVVDVGNSGAPPPADLVPQLFEKFGVGESGRHGLGLYFCRQVAELHGGTIELCALPELRTNFRICLQG